jgi:hypothetical protein
MPNIVDADTQIALALRAFNRDKRSNLKTALGPFLNLEFLTQIVAAFLAGEIKNKANFHSYLRYVIAAQLHSGKGPAAELFQGYVNAQVDPNKYRGFAAYQRQAQVAQDAYIVRVLAGSFLGQLEATALRDVLVQAGVPPFSIEYFDFSRFEKRRLVEVSPPVFGEFSAEFTVPVQNDSGNTHFTPPSGSASGAGNNCLIDTMMQGIVRHCPQTAKRRLILAAGEQETDAGKEDKKPVAAQASPVTEQPAANPTVFSVADEVFPTHARKLVRKPPIATAVATTPSSRGTVRKASELPKIKQPLEQFRVQQKPVSLAQAPALFAPREGGATRPLLPLSVFTSVDRVMINTNDENERSRLQRLAKTLKGQEELIRMDVDRLCALQLANTGKFTPVDADAIAKAVMNNDERTLEQLMKAFALNSKQKSSTLAAGRQLVDSNNQRPELSPRPRVRV